MLELFFISSETWQLYGANKIKQVKTKHGTHGYKFVVACLSSLLKF